MSTETPIVRNFIGLDELEGLISEFQLTVNLGYGNQILAQGGDVVPVGLGDIRDIGLSLQTKADTASLLQAIGKAGLKAEDVSLYVVVEGRFLKNRDLLHQVSILQITETIPIVQWKSPRPDSMNDRRHGFDIQVVFALNKQIEHVPLRPRRLGTILAETSFGVKSTKLGEGFSPQPLTAEVRGNRLPKGTVLWVEPLGLLFDAESLDEAVTVYIDEDLHSDIGTLRTKESKMVQVQLALEALAQIVFIASLELADREISEDDEQSVLGQYLYSQMSMLTGVSIKEPRDALVKVKNEPTTVAAQFTSQLKYKAMIQTLLRGEEVAQ
jgi:hypothetical protein